MAELKKVAALVENVEKVVTVEAVTREAGYELFLTETEARGLRTILGLGTTTKTLNKLGIEGLWESMYSEVGIDYNLTFSQVAKLIGE